MRVLFRALRGQAETLLEFHSSSSTLRLTKRVDLLKEAVPGVTKVAVMSNPDQGDLSELGATRKAARHLGLAIEHFQVRTDESFGLAFTAIAQSGCNALLAFPDALTFLNRQAIANFAVRHRLPSIFGWKPYVEAGG
jgi:ABC-type uncharacterized transport system substrate-binding protein